MDAHSPSKIFAAAVWLVAAPVWPSDLIHAFAGNQFAGEIIVSPQIDINSSHTNASDQVDRARSNRKDEAPNATTIIILPEGADQGVLTPGHSGTQPNAQSIRLKARKYQQNGSQSSEPGALRFELSEDETTAQGQARDNRKRASNYAKGDLKSILTGKVGADGIPIVVCKGVNNQAGRIGDDIESGSVFSVVQNGRSVKVRCQ
jgi:hypothetical protein